MAQQKIHITKTNIVFFICTLLILIGSFSCKDNSEDELTNPGYPTVRTTDIFNVTPYTALVGGKVTDEGSSPVLVHGLCWSASQNPVISGSHTTDGSGTGTFTGSLTGLSANTTYYVRAYATNAAGTAYGSQMSFTTLANSTPVTDYDGNVYSTVTIGTQTWTKENLKTTHYRNGSAIPNFTDGSAWSNLNTGAYCYYENNSANGNTYGALYNWQAVNTENLCPTGWHVPSDTEWTTLIDYLGGESVAGGKLKSLTGWNDPNNGATNESSFSALPGGYRYYGGTFCGIGDIGYWWSTTEGGTTSAWGRTLLYDEALVHQTYCGKVDGFSVRCLRDDNTQTTLPVITTADIVEIAQNSATGGGNVTSDGNGTITARGVCWSTTQNPDISGSHTTDGSGTGIYSSSLSGLTANSTYYARAYATNSAGTAYGSEVSFTTLANSNTITDYDGNVYNILTIGTQTWIKENLKTTHYRDGAAIPNVTDGTDWSNLTTGAYCYNENNSANNNTYGALYNWNAVNTGKLCPIGWHVPSNAEWTALTDYLGGKEMAGGKLKEANTTHWAYPNTGATNETGFTALPGGYRGSFGTFDDVGYYGYWWSATEFSVSSAWDRLLSYNISNVWRNYVYKVDGYSVRCLRDY